MSEPAPTVSDSIGEAGYALVAAVASIIFFAVIALGILAMTQRAVLAGSADVDAARASAAAEAGIALALRDLITESRAGPVPVDGRVQQRSFDGAELAISVTDERGKVPLNLLDEKQLTSLLEYAGLSGSALEIARDSYSDWIDDDEEPRADGAERDHYEPLGIRPRNAGFVTLGELGRVRGFSPAVVQRIAADATADFGSGSFDIRVASPDAIRIMYVGDSAAVAEIEQSRIARGQTTAFAFTDKESRTGRPMTIDVRARVSAGAIGQRTCVIELTGAVRRPYVIRHCV